MGQAKQRGTFEDRKRQAIELDRQILKQCLFGIEATSQQRHDALESACKSYGRGNVLRAFVRTRKIRRIQKSLVR